MEQADVYININNAKRRKDIRGREKEPWEFKEAKIMFDLESDLFLLWEEAFIYKYLLSSYYVPVAILRLYQGSHRRGGIWIVPWRMNMNMNMLLGPEMSQASGREGWKGQDGRFKRWNKLARLTLQIDVLSTWWGSECKVAEGLPPPLSLLPNPLLSGLESDSPGSSTVSSSNPILDKIT